MGRAPTSRIPTSLTARVADAVAQRAGAVTGRGLEPENRITRRRIELLQLMKPEDQDRWQMLHNDRERYSVIEARYNHVRSDIGIEHSCLVIYDEIGDNLPLVRPKDSLRSGDADRIREDARPTVTSFDDVFGEIE